MKKGKRLEMKRYLVVITILLLLVVFCGGCAGSDSSQNGFFLTVTQPTNESITNNDKVEVTGITVPSAVVSVNGDIAGVDTEGNFTMMVTLEEGPNLIEVIASDLNGDQESSTLTTIYVPLENTEAGLFLSVTQPENNSTTSSNKSEVKGITSPEAVVTINGELAEVDAEGNFTMTVALEEGPNLIEVIASDTEGNQESRTFAVIYVP